METIQNDLISKIKPYSFLQILELYTKAWEGNEVAPFLRLRLQNYTLEGDLVDVDFGAERLILREIVANKSLNLEFVDFRQVQGYALLGMEHCEGFVGLMQ